MPTRTRTLEDLAGSDTIDSRNLIARLRELERNADVEDERDELIALRDICEQGESFSDWTYGETLIRESYFTEYAQELAEDLTPGLREMQWPLNHIDWDAAAEALKMDYGTIEIEGETYYIRL